MQRFYLKSTQTNIFSEGSYCPLKFIYLFLTSNNLDVKKGHIGKEILC